MTMSGFKESVRYFTFYYIIFFGVKGSRHMWAGIGIGLHPSNVTRGGEKLDQLFSAKCQGENSAATIHLLLNKCVP